MAGRWRLFGFHLSFVLLFVPACERPGASYENGTTGTVYITDVLKPEELPAGHQFTSDAISLEAGQSMMSVWRVGEHRLIDIMIGNGKHFRFEGASLDHLAQRCPKGCILRITKDGIKPIRQDFFGETEL